MPDGSPAVPAGGVDGRTPRRHLVRIAGLLFIGLALFLGRGAFTTGYYDSAVTLLGHYPWRSEVPPPPPRDMNRLLTDQPTQFLVWRDFAANEIRQGRLPLWNPWAAAGRPLLANSQSAVFSPYHVGHYVFGERVGALWSAAARFLVAGFGMWVLARRLNLSEAGAAFAAVSFAFSAPIVIGLGHPHGAGYTALPWLLVAAHALAMHPGPGAAATAAAAVALAFVTGHPETTFLMVVGSGLWGLWLLWRTAPRRWATARWAIGGIAAGLLLAAAHWLPFVDYLWQSSAWAARAVPGEQAATPLRAVSLVAWLLPNFFGHPQGTPFWLADQDFQSISAYAGLAAPLLAVYALRPREMSGPVRGLALVALVCALAVYGCPPLPWLLGRLPLFQSAMNQRLLTVVVAAVAVLGGLGLDRLAARSTGRRWWLACAGLGALIVLVGVFANARPAGLPTLGPSLVHAGAVLGVAGAVLAAGGGPWAVVAITLVEVSAWGYRFNPITPAAQHYPTTPFIAALQAELGDDPQRRLLARGYVFPAETPMRFGIRDVKGYDAIESARYARYLELAMRTGRGTGALPPPQRRVPLMATYRSRLLDAAAASVIVSAEPLSDVGLSTVATAPGLYAYRNARALPRARLARTVEHLPTPDAVAERLAQPDHDPAAVTLLEGLPGERLEAGAGRVTFLLDEPTRVQLEVEAETDAVLVLADVMFPGWEATIDGQPTTIWTADLAFRAVRVPQGRHLVEFGYYPRSVRWGLALSTVGLTAFVLLGLTGVRRRRAPA